jgi:hypothetical protein
MVCIAAVINRIGVSEAPRDDLANGGFDWQIHIGQPAAKPATELPIRQGPVFLSRIAWELRAKNS